MIAASAAASNGSLQAWIDETPAGGTLLIPAGNYTGPLVIAKPIELRVEPGATAVLQHSGEEPAIRIEADRVTLADLHIHDHADQAIATVVLQGDEAVLDNLLIRTSTTAIRAQQARQVEVRSSTIIWNGERDTKVFARGDGIALYQTHDARLVDNVIEGVRDGIYLERSDHTLVSGNHIERSRYGIHCMYTQGTIIHENTGVQNLTGAMVMVVRDADVSGNTFTKQAGNVHAQGILLYDVQNSLVQDNVVEGNRAGLYVDQSSGNAIVNNRIAYNFIGLQLLKSDDNVITNNLFLGNVSDAQAKDSVNPELSGNYWDRFEGLDMDGDGRSNLSYAIHPFFANLVQQKPVFQLFFQSPGIQFLENLVQSDREQWIGDSSPLLSPPLSIHSTSDSPDQSVGVSGFLMFSCTCMFILWCRRKNQ